METVKIGEYEVMKEYMDLFSKIFNNNTFAVHFLNCFFEHRKRYKWTKGFEFSGKRIFIKDYADHFDEAEDEWKNLFMLKKLGFSVPEPFFISRKEDKIEIATFALKGEPLSSLLLANKEKQTFLVAKLAELIASLHVKNLYHQDCYLYHFFWDEESETLSFLDVPRVLQNPLFSLKYQIKDLGQLGYSFEECFGKTGKELFQQFLNYYLNFSKIKHTNFLIFLVKLKMALIRWRTERAKLKGKKLL
jgi:tRNA A-37 threonylcarbamoyl transferase component Bud32